MNPYLIICIILALGLSYSFIVCSYLNKKNLELRIKLRSVKVAIDCFGDNKDKLINKINEILEEHYN